VFDGGAYDFEMNKIKDIDITMTMACTGKAVQCDARYHQIAASDRGC